MLSQRPAAAPGSALVRVNALLACPRLSRLTSSSTFGENQCCAIAVGKIADNTTTVISSEN